MKTTFSYKNIKIFKVGGYMYWAGCQLKECLHVLLVNHGIVVQPADCIVLSEEEVVKFKIRTEHNEVISFKEQLVRDVSHISGIDVAPYLFAQDQMFSHPGD